VVGLIHPEKHFTDDKAGGLRRRTYRQLRRHWHFENALGLFDIGPTRSFGVHVYGLALDSPSFLSASNLYHPETVERSLLHDGSGSEPSHKTEGGKWELRPHSHRIFRVDEGLLAAWREILEEGNGPVLETRMVYVVNRSTAEVLSKLAAAPRLASLQLEYSQGWNETTEFNRGVFEKTWGEPETPDRVILQGPHLYVANPAYKSPNPTMKHKQDWSPLDLETLSADSLPVTSYKPSLSMETYSASYTHWGANRVPARDYFRVAWRNMAANGGERTLIPAIIPPGFAHIHGVTSAGSLAIPQSLASIAGAMASLLLDFSVRVAPKSTISAATVSRLAFPQGKLDGFLRLRSLRLNAVTQLYAKLWEDAYLDDFRSDVWAGGINYEGRPLLGDVGPAWAEESPLRRASDRRQALVEIDAIVALALGISAEELCTIYRSQFAVLYGYDRNRDFYDRCGRLVPSTVISTWRKKGNLISPEERTATNASGNTYTYELPFVNLDREADMRQAYAHFEQVLSERS
jgi:hypothetical protein